MHYIQAQTQCMERERERERGRERGGEEETCSNRELVGAIDNGKFGNSQGEITDTREPFD